MARRLSLPAASPAVAAGLLMMPLVIAAGLWAERDGLARHAVSDFAAIPLRGTLEGGAAFSSNPIAPRVRRVGE